MPSVAEIVTEKIMAQLNKGIAPWKQPWKDERFNSSGPFNAISGRNYSGVNVFLLKASSMAYACPGWATIKQVNELGGSVIAGEKASPCIFWKVTPKATINGKEENGSFVLRYYSVFNMRQTTIYENWAEKHKPEEKKPCLWTGPEGAEKLLISKNPVINYGGNVAAYYPSKDVIFMPNRTQFKDAVSFFETAFHELTHWTGSEKRLNRIKATAFASSSYSQEELVAEIGAASLLNLTGMENQSSLEQSASYCEHWSGFLKDNVKAIISASSQAQKAVDFITGIAESKEL